MEPIQPIQPRHVIPRPFFIRARADAAGLVESAKPSPLVVPAVLLASITVMSTQSTMGAVSVLGVPYSCSVAWRLVRAPYSVGRTRALRCIAHVHVTCCIGRGRSTPAEPWRWRLLDVAGWMLPHAIYSMVRHVVAWDRCVAHQWHFPSCSVTRTHSICKRHVAL